MDQNVREQILSIRNMRLTNMFDLPAVQRLAFERGYYELVFYIEDHKEAYVHFILTGEESIPESTDN